MRNFNKTTYRMPDLSHFPWLSDLVDEIHTNTGMDKRVILIMIFGVLSCVLQKLYKAKCPSFEPMPIVLMIWIIGGSGAGKSELFKLLTRMLSRNEKRNLAKYLDKLDRYLARVRIWMLDGKINDKTYKQAKEAGECTKAIEKKILKHQTQMPKPPRKPVMMHNDSSIYAMIQNVMDNHVALLLGSSDAVSMLDKKEFKKLFPILLERFSGMEYSRSRKNEGRADLSHTLITVLLMIQENTLRGVWDDIGDYGRQIGLWARTMFCIFPDDTTDKPALPDNPDWTHTRAFEEKLQYFLDLTDKHLDDLDIQPEIVEQSPEAAEYNGRLLQWICEQKQEGGAFSNMHDIANRIAELSGRLAVILHAGSMKKGDVELDTLKTAIDIYMSFLPDLVKIVDCEATEISNAKKFYHWLKTRRISRGQRYISWSKCLRGVIPKYLQDADLLHDALDVLTSQGRVSTFKCGTATCLELDPDIYFDYHRAASELATNDNLHGKIVAPLQSRWIKADQHSHSSESISSDPHDIKSLCFGTIPDKKRYLTEIAQTIEADDPFNKYLM